jgi:signal transduction histidine kinase
VNPRHDRLDSLANYLSRFSYEFLSAAEIRCRLEVPMPLPGLPVAAEVRHNLFLALKESLHNVVKHAAATEARIELKLEPQRIVLSVTDNGRGFDPEDTSKTGSPDRLASGHGLSNMKHRLEEIGGICEFDSRSGTGTTIKFSVPIEAWPPDVAAPS